MRLHRPADLINHKIPVRNVFGEAVGDDQIAVAVVIEIGQQRVQLQSVWAMPLKKPISLKAGLPNFTLLPKARALV
jgi:hypothetical protein